MGERDLMQFQQEFLSTAKAEGQALMENHFSELRPGQWGFDFDWDTYHKYEELGVLKVFTARDSGKLVGYLSVLLVPDLHSKGSLIAREDGLFLSKPYRKGLTAVKFIRFVEKCLTEDGLQVFLITGTEENPIDSIMKRMGYNHIESVFSKRLSV